MLGYYLINLFEVMDNGVDECDKRFYPKDFEVRFIFKFIKIMNSVNLFFKFIILFVFSI